jgi:hypothetical protein
MWQLVALGNQTETTTDNLLTNKDFDSELDSWTIEDSDYIKYDGSCYSSTGLCQSVRWSSNLGKTISQTINNLDDNYIIKNVYVSFTALGCNNTAAGGWCTQDAYDKVQVTINLSDGTNQENVYLEQELDYNDGTLDYALSTSTLDTWLTQDTSINFAMTGIDTGNWDGQFGPIVDNINLQLGIEEYVPVVAQPTVIEPVVVEPIIEEPIVVEEIKVEEQKMVEGLDLNTEVTLDIINDIDVVNPLPEIQEIKIEEPEQLTMASPEETPEIETTTNEPSDIRTEGENNGKEETKEAKQDNKESSEESKDSKDNNKPVSIAKAKTTTTKSKSTSTKAESKTAKTDGAIEQPVLPVEYLQIITESITIQETISLTQEMIYGRQQEYNLNTSSITIAGLDNNSSSRWRNLQDERKRFKAPVYRKKGQ